MTENKWHILLVDDERSLREPLAKLLTAEYNLIVDTAANKAEAWRYISGVEEPYDVVLIDDMLVEDENDLEAYPIAAGIDLMSQIKEYAPSTECIIFTGWGGVERGIEALRAGAYRYMSKPFDHEELAMTIEMAAQNRDLRKKYEVANQQKQWLQTFMKVGQAINSIHSFDDVLTEVHRQMGRLMDVSEMDIVIFDEISQMIYFELCYDRGIQQPKWQRPFGDGFTEWVISQGQPLLIKHLDQEKENLPVPPKIVYFDDGDDDITQSHLGVPLIVSGKVIGVINVQSYPPNQFDETDQYILSAVASQVAIAIDNSRLITRVRNEREYRQALLQSSLDAIVAIDNDKHITVFNREAEIFFGRAKEEMLGKRTADLFEDVAIGRRIFDELDGGDSIKEWQINFQHKSGQSLPGLFSGTVIRNESGQPIGQAGFIRDLQQVKLLEARQQAWTEVSQAVTNSGDLNEFLNLILRSATESIPAANDSEIHLYHEGVLSLAAHTIKYSEEAKQAIRFKIGEGINGKVFESRQPMIISDVNDDSRFKVIDQPGAAPFQSMVCIPIQTKEQVMGTLALTSNIVEAFEDVDIDLLNSFANQAAVFIKSSQLLEEAQQGLSSLKSISEASSVLISKQEPQKVLDEIVVQVKKALQATRVSVILIDEDGRPHDVADIGYEEAPDVATVIRENGISVRVVEQGEPIFVENIETSGEDLNPDMLMAGIQAAACIPLKLRDRAIGVTWIQFIQPRTFSITEKEALQIFSEQAALAYDKTRQMQELQHMRQAAVALAGAADLNQVLEQIVSSARTVLKADSTAIWSYDDIRQKFLIDYSVAEGIDPEIWKKFKLEEPQVGQTAHTVMNTGSIDVENVADWERYPFLGESTRLLFKQVGIESFQGIALTVGDERLGVLYINYNHPRHFSSEELETAATFAHHAALALKKARLLETVSRTQKAARIVAQVTALENLEDALDSVVKGVIKAVDCDAVTLYVYNHQGDRLIYPPAVDGLKYPDKTHELPEVPEGSIVRIMLVRDEPYIVEDTENNPEFKNRRFVKDEEIKSCVAIPLKVGTIRVGVLFVNYRQFHRFTSEKLENIELFANQAAVAIRNAQLYEHLQRRADILQSLNKAGSRINESLRTDETYNEIIEQAVRITKHKGEKISFACIRLVENNKMRLVSTYPREFIVDQAHTFTMEIDLEKGFNGRIGLIGQAVKDGKSQLEGDVYNNPQHIRSSPDTNSELAVPIKFNEQTIAVICIEHQEMNAFDIDDQRALEALAVQAAVAIRNTQLYEQSIALRRVAEALSGKSELDEVLELVMEEAMKFTNSKMGGITFWDEEKNEAGEALRTEGDGLLYRYRSVARKDGITRKIVETRQTNVTPDKLKAENPNPIYKERGFLSEVGVPIVNREKVHAVLYIRHAKPYQFSDMQIQMLEILGRQAGVAIERAKQLEDMRQIKGFIGNKTAVEWIQMASTSWGHSINREIGIARGRLALLKTIAASKVGDEFDAELENLKKMLDRIADIPITAPLSYEDAIDAVAVNNLLQTYLNRQWTHARYKNISLSLDLQTDSSILDKVWASPEWLRRGFELIIDNAVWALIEAKTKTPEIRVATSYEKNKIFVTIQDNGPGITDEIFELIQKEEAIPKQEGDRGSGIGIRLAQTIFQTYHGGIEINRREVAGTEVVVMLPIFQAN